jgi:diaminopimelate epimerase
VWERGCGETRACGSGTVAAAIAAMASGRAELPMRLHLPGGVLQVARRPDGEVLLTGPVVELRRT